MVPVECGNSACPNIVNVMPERFTNLVFCSNECHKVWLRSKKGYRGDVY